MFIKRSFIIKNIVKNNFLLKSNKKFFCSTQNTGVSFELTDDQKAVQQLAKDFVNKK